jgi:hypothetical protein
MRKLTLDLDRLEVESFTTAPAAEERGTVRGNAVVVGPGATVYTEPVVGPDLNSAKCPISYPEEDGPTYNYRTCFQSCNELLCNSEMSCYGRASCVGSDCTKMRLCI